MNLREWRKLEKLSAKKLAELCDVSPESIRAYENGTRRPRPDVARRIEAVTAGSVTASALLGLRTVSVSETPREFESSAKLNLDVSDEDLKDAKELGLDPKQIAERAIAEKIKEARLKAWNEKNKEALKQWESYFNKNGMWNDDFRPF